MIMKNTTIPIILTSIVLVAGIFALMPIDQASTVHTTILEGSTNFVEVTLTATGNDGDFVVTCPTTADSCKFLEVFLENDIADQTVDPGDILATISDEAAFTIVADAGAAAGNDLSIALNGVSNFAMGPGDSIRLEMTSSGGGSAYTLRVIAEVEGGETITVARIGNLA